MNTLIPVQPASEYRQTNQAIRVKDGIQLIGDLYIPRGEPPFPAVMQITPYRAQDLSRLGEIYAARGYLFLAVDARGRYRSEGEWDPGSHDQSDGHAVIEWLVKHPLCNGRIGTRGLAWSGYTQMLTAIDAPTALQAMVVIAGPADPFINSPFLGGAYDLHALYRLLNMTGRCSLGKMPQEDFGIRRFGTENTDENPYETDTAEMDAAPSSDQAAAADRELQDQACRQSPFTEIDLRFGVFQPVFRQWVQHWQLDEFWRHRSVGDRLEHISVPTLFISGWWDNNGRGATYFFRRLDENVAKKGADAKHRLLMGPWDQDLKSPDCADLPASEARLIQRAAKRDQLNDEFAWMDAHLLEYPPGPSTQARVSLYLTGLHRWLDFEDWPPPDSEQVVFYLHPQRGDNDQLLQTMPTETPAYSSYTFDPQDPTPFARPAIGAQKCPFDNAEIAASRNDILVFESAALTEPMALVGEVSALLYAQVDTADFDLCVKLLDRYPDGRAIYLADGVLRARFREDWSQPIMVTPGEIYPYRIDLWHLGHVLLPGHALRIEVASGAFRRIDINACNGDDLATSTGKQSANVRLYHSAEHPSQVLLPLCRDSRLLGLD